MSSMTKRPYLTLWLAVCVASFMTACGNNGNNENASQQSSATANAQDAKSKSSQEVAQGVTEDEILIGHLGPQTGPVAIYDEFRKGMNAYFDYVNENGGVKDRQITLVAYDDQYQPSKTVKLARRLVEEDEVFAIAGDVGTPSNSAVKDYFKNQGVPVVMVSSGSSQFVNPPIPNYLGSSIINYELEAKIITDYAISELGAKRIGIGYQNDDYGTPLSEAAKKAIQKDGNAEIVAEVNFQSGDSDLSSQAQKLKNANPDTVLVFSVPAPVSKLKKAMYSIGFDSSNFLVSSVGANEKKLFELAGPEVWEGTYSTSVIPMPEESDSENMQLFKDRFSQQYPDAPLAGSAQLGWAIGQTVVEALKRTDELTWDAFLDTFYTFDNWSGSLYRGVTFSENNHYGLTSLFITEAQDGRIVPITDTITFDPASGEIAYPNDKDRQSSDVEESQTQSGSGQQGDGSESKERNNA